ncbi:hypothetical protein PUN28_011810 [Cardiocondyla obscurior]|uniref:Uncharacterized protein n=1 Tax=Cardiocondyla obscurior TaxID=286306 RepID=A0AAW2FH41_9HYME
MFCEFYAHLDGHDNLLPQAFKRIEIADYIHLFESFMKYITAKQNEVNEVDSIIILIVNSEETLLTFNRKTPHLG